MTVITQEMRRVELHRNPAPPPGLESHAAGLRHEVQPGDSAWAISRDYAMAYHMNMDPTGLQNANRNVFAGGLHPGELLRIPGLQDRFDSFIASAGTHVPDLTHTVRSGETLFGIARDYSRRTGATITAEEIYAANRKTIGGDPTRIVPGQVLTIPGTGQDGFEIPPLQSIGGLDNDLLVTRVARVQHEGSGDIEQMDVMRFRANVSDAVYAGRSVNEAIGRLSHPGGGAGNAAVSAIVQVKGGAFHIVPLEGREAGNLDHTDRVLSLAFRAEDRAVSAIAHRDARTGAVTVRRFDQ